MKSLSSLVYSKGLAYSNIGISLIYIFFTVFLGNGTLSSSYKNSISNKQLAYLFSGILGSYAINKAANHI